MQFYVNAGFSIFPKQYAVDNLMSDCNVSSNTTNNARMESFSKGNKLPEVLTDAKSMIDPTNKHKRSQALYKNHKIKDT